MKEILDKLSHYQPLERNEAREILIQMAEGRYNGSEMAAFITSYMMRSITVEELAGFRDAMLNLCVAIDLSEFDPIDLCGTGGDGKNTFNISTISSFVVAGAGYRVAKHGNNGVSSVCGSSNILSHFGYQFTNDYETLRSQIEESGICFLHAPLFHPAMKNVAPIRKELGIKTFFNMLGPLVNPASPAKQLMGVYDLRIARIYGYLHQMLDKDYAIVHSLDGYDEVSLTGSFKLISNNGERIIDPREYGFDLVSPNELQGGDSIDAASEIFMNILKCQSTEAQTAVVTINSALAISTADVKLTFEDAIEKARYSLKSGAAFEAFKGLLKMGVSV